MISQQTFGGVIDSQGDFLEKKSTGVDRQKMQRVEAALGFATIITGIRRCGKSTLLLQLKKKYSLGKPVYLNFEDPRLAYFEISDFERLYTEIQRRKTRNVFFDEIQLATGWEIFVNQLLREDFQVFITGSNASLLSKELGTHLTGRHLSYELFPFSYHEFLDFFKLEPSEKSFKDYLLKGGMPDYLRTKIDQYLNDLLDDIVIRDVAIRHGLRDLKSLRQLAVYLLTNTGSLVSANSLSGMFGIQSSTTLLSYFSYLADAYLVEFVPLFDYSYKKQIRNPQKVYAMDLGLHRQNEISFSENMGHALENAVYLHLRQSHQHIYYFQREGECDFLTTTNGVPTQVYQVCADLNNINLDREVNGLFRAMKYFNLAKGQIITLSQTDKFTKEGAEVEVLPAWRWMTPGYGAAHG